MTAPSSIDPAAVLHEHLAQASPDLMRELLSTFIDALLSADADAVCGAGWGQVSPDRVNRRNGYRHRDFDTRAGTIEVAVHHAAERAKARPCRRARQSATMPPSAPKRDHAALRPSGSAA